MTLLTLRDLQVSFGDRTIVRIEELTCGRGEILGLVGESGSGKSMTANAILGLASRFGANVEGSIQLEGQELVGATESVLRSVRGRRIAMIFQDPGSAFSPVLRVGELFIRALRLHGLSRRLANQRAQSVLKDLHLPHDALRRYPHQLSGGQLQRVAIGLALALHADLLIADEATSALDVTIQAEILHLLLELRDERELSILMITHDLAVVAETADRVAVMRAGSILEVADKTSLLNSPSHTYTRQLLQAVPTLSTVKHAVSH